MKVRTRTVTPREGIFIVGYSNVAPSVADKLARNACVLAGSEKHFELY